MPKDLDEPVPFLNHILLRDEIQIAQADGTGFPVFRCPGRRGRRLRLILLRRHRGSIDRQEKQKGQENALINRQCRYLTINLELCDQVSVSVRKWDSTIYRIKDETKKVLFASFRRIISYSFL